MKIEPGTVCRIVDAPCLTDKERPKKPPQERGDWKVIEKLTQWNPTRASA